MQCVEGAVGSFGEGEYHGNCIFSLHEKSLLYQIKKIYFSIDSLLGNHNTFLKDLPSQNRNPNHRF